jgi:hypothetical protein
MGDVERPEVPHADLIARLRQWAEDGSVPPAAANAIDEAIDVLAALGDTVPASTLGKVATSYNEALREARAERDALAHVIEQAPHAPGCEVHGLWILPVHGLVAVQQSGKCTCWKSTAPAASRALQDAEVRRAFAAEVVTFPFDAGWREFVSRAAEGER